MTSSLEIALVGPGRLGTALGRALREAGAAVEGPLGREAAPSAPVVLLTVPDASIAQAAATIAPGPKVGHCSGATTLAPLAGHAAFSLHPLMTVPATGASFAGVPAAVAGDPVAAEIAELLGMVPFHVADEDRAAYHAAASIASNLLVILEDAAERVARSAGVERQALVPLVRATVDNWAAHGRAALTGPIARGDTATMDRHREALRDRAPDLLEMYEALAAC
jgi:predicted short-subunit dehydrogenase-like oxidoreductase (DUF2520 family)